jgi:hypothetical protein
MTQEQTIHVGVINSFNLITERNSFEEIVESDLSLFAHNPNTDPSIDVINFMIDYFKSYEMFENCVELMKYLKENYDDNGDFIFKECECQLPLITEYSEKMYCGECGKRLKK